MGQSSVDKPVWTYADYCVLPQDFNRHEIIEGDHVVTPSPTTRHQRVLARLTSLLIVHVEARGLGVVLAAPMDVLLAPTSVVQPDLLFISKERLGIITEANIQGSPDLVVEVLSPSTAAIDRGGKMALYARYGVPHYWILDARHLTLETYEIREGEYELTSQFKKDDPVTVRLFPDLAITLAELGK
jgi:Uma2 family endonuclease